MDIDWKNPDYKAIFLERTRRLQVLDKDPSLIPALKVYYKEHVAQFISDFGMTIDPRNVERGLPALVPFVLFQRQIDWVSWLLTCWRSQKPGITEKSRDMGMSWLAAAVAVTLCLFNDDMAIGFGSKKEELVDRLGDPKSLFFKIRMFLQYLPKPFRGGWDVTEHAPYMRIVFPQTGSVITGEAGDSIGRGDRKSIYFIDEAAHLERPQLIDASLSATTNCRIDISSVNGMANSFAMRRHSGKISVFTAHWRDDPRKDDEWYAKKCEELDPVTIAQEIDLSYNASVEGVLIPSAWVQASIDAHLKLGIEPTGDKRGALDIADQGMDRNAFIGRHGILVQHAESWSGKGSDTYKSAVKAVNLCDDLGYRAFDYDADGMGASVRGDVNAINERRTEESKHAILISAFRGSATGESLYDPQGEMVEGRINIQFFMNLKSQSWWALRLRFRNTYRAVVEGMEVDPDSIISLSSSLPELSQLTMELSQPKYSRNEVGKLRVDKAPPGTKSPNLGDGVMMVFNPCQREAEIWQRIADMA